jgi:diadenosine tetraphosphate (Ap4A) HIT family hydrolase
MALSVISNQICCSLKLVTRSVSVLSLLLVMIERPASSFPTGLIAHLHPPPPCVDYADNPTVFGKILRGEMSADIMDESPTLLAFRDKHPRAPLHSLIIPKQFVPSVFDLTDAALLQELQDMAHELLQQHQPQAYTNQDYVLCFHVPPFNSIDHLHLHVLAPKTSMSTMATLKYKVGARWCTSDQHVALRLQQGQMPVPYEQWKLQELLGDTTKRLAPYSVLILLPIWVLHWALSQQ